MIRQLSATEPILQQRNPTFSKYLVDKGLGSRLTYLESQQAADHANEKASSWAVQQSRLDEAGAALTTIIENRNAEAAEYNRKQFEELAEAERKAAGLSGDLVKAEQRTKLQLLTAPVDGVVQQLAIHDRKAAW